MKAKKKEHEFEMEQIKKRFYDENVFFYEK